MKHCPDCETTYDDDSEVCELCDVPLVGGDDSIEVEEADGEEVVDDEADIAPAAGENEDEAEPDAGPEMLFPTDAKTERQPRKESDRAKTLASELEQIEGSGLFTIGIIGFATSGKTFFINRLKKYLRREGGYEPDPAPAPDETAVEGTVDIETHRFDVIRADAEGGGGESTRHFRKDREPFYLIDIPGEQVRRAFDANLSGSNAETLIKVLRLSHALILVLPANEILAPVAGDEEWHELITIEAELSDLGEPAAGESALVEKRRSRLGKRQRALRAKFESEDPLDSLLENISKLSAIASDLTDENGEQLSLERYQQMSEEERSRTYAGPRRGPAPFTYVALSKADVLMRHDAQTKVRKAFPHIDDPASLDRSPSDLLRLLRPEIHRRILQSFNWHTFDFVTCFDGQPNRSTKIHYRLKHFGVVAVVDWIHWARSYARRVGRWDAPEQTSRFTKLRRGWNKLEGWLVRKLRNLRESGSVGQPGSVGLNEAMVPRPRSGPLALAKSAIGRLISVLMAQNLGLLRAALAVAWLSGVLMLSLYLFGALGTSDRRGFAFELEPIYAAETRQMEGDLPVFGTGMLETSLRRWSNVPDDGGWFSFRPGTPAREALNAAMNLIPRGAAISQINEQTAREAISNLQAAAGANQRDIRAANSYHEGLLHLRLGQPDEAVRTFQAANTALTEAEANPPAGRQYDLTRSRVPAVRIAVLNGLGVAELQRGNVAAADAALTTAHALLTNHHDVLADRSQLSSPWFALAARDQRPMIDLASHEVWTNLLAARIRQHRMAQASGDREAADRAREALEELVADARPYRDSAASRARLAGNLMIASARVGRADSGFYVDVEGATGAEEIGRYLATIQGTEATADRDSRFWPTIRGWRQRLNKTRDNDGVGAPAYIERVLAQRSSEEQPALRAWLTEMAETGYARSPRRIASRITLNYGQYYDGIQRVRDWDARAPFGFYLGVLLAAIVLAFGVLAFLSMRHVRMTYQRLHMPKHRLDRLGSSQG